MCFLSQVQKNLHFRYAELLENMLYYSKQSEEHLPQVCGIEKELFL